MTNYKQVKNRFTPTRTTKGLTAQDWKPFIECLIKANVIQLAMMATMIDDEETRRKEQRNE